MLSNGLNILIPDGESTFAFLVIPCLAEIPNVKLHVLSSKKKNPIRHSKYVASFTVFETKKYDDRWLDDLQSIIAEKSIDIIVPIAEAEFRFCIQEQANLSCKRIALPSLESFDIATNKLHLNTFCVAHGIPVPNSVYVEAGVAKVASIAELRFPIIIKPLDAEGGGGIVKFESPQELEQHIAAHNSQTYFLQEYVTGYDIDCSVLCHNGEILTHTIQKGCLQGATPYKQQLGVVFLENDSLLSVVKRLMAHLKWSGIAHIDLRYDAQDGTYKVLEINARFWGSLQASRHVGVNFPRLCIEAAYGANIGFVPYKYAPFLQLKGIIKTIKRQPKKMFDVHFIWNHTDFKNTLKDPLPMLYKVWYWFQRQF